MKNQAKDTTSSDIAMSLSVPLSLSLANANVSPLTSEPYMFAKHKEATLGEQLPLHFADDDGFVRFPILI